MNRETADALFRICYWLGLEGIYQSALIRGIRSRSFSRRGIYDVSLALLRAKDIVASDYAPKKKSLPS